MAQNSDLTYDGQLITVLRGLSGGKYLVVQGACFRAGLHSNYREFDNYGAALDHFNDIKR